jgi:hypothetical protein
MSVTTFTFIRSLVYIMNKHFILQILALIIFAAAAAAMISSPWSPQIVDGKAFLPSNFAKAPVAMSADNVYVVWFSNKTGNDEVMFRVSNDNVQTFADKINLSNTTYADSQDVQIAADGDIVIVSWWERNATSNEPFVRISGDNGATFGPLLKLSTNGTISAAG